MTPPSRPPAEAGARPGAGGEPLVSVVVATNRGGPYLAEALASATAQTYPHVEIVLVDDGAPDPDALDAAGAAADARVIHRPASGVSAARNAGAAASRGDLLVFLDDDDRWHPERLARQAATLAQAPHAVASYCGMRVVDADGTELVPADQRAVRDVHEVLRRVTGIMLPNLMLRRDVFERVGGFRPDIRFAEDLDLVLRVALEGDFVFADGPLVDYRAHDANTTRRHRELALGIDRVVRSHLAAAQAAGREDLVADHRASLAANSRYIAWNAARDARRLAREGAVHRAAGEVVWAVVHAPTAPLEWVRKRLPGSR